MDSAIKFHKTLDVWQNGTLIYKMFKLKWNSTDKTEVYASPGKVCLNMTWKMVRAGAFWDPNHKTSMEILCVFQNIIKCFAYV